MYSIKKVVFDTNMIYIDQIYLTTTVVPAIYCKQKYINSGGTAHC
jgi:hypothetical protein